MSDIKLSQSLSKIQDTLKGKTVSLLSFIFIFACLPMLIRPFWPLLIDKIGKGYPLYILIVNVPFYKILLTYNISMYFIYTRKWSFFQQYRILDKPWPWEEDKQKWNKQFSSSMKIILLNNIVFSHVFMYFGYLLTGGDLKFVDSLELWPSFKTILWQFLFFIIIEDTLFYWGHWLLHRPSLYWIHKKHHQYITPITISAISSHPIQFILTGALPSGIGFMILSNFTSVHYVTIYCWLTFRFIEAFDGHCGYNWSWGQLSFFPWRVRPEYHDFHHSHNVGNYVSMFTFWDSLMGTNIDFEKFKKNEVRNEVLEKQKIHKVD